MTSPVERLQIAYIEGLGRIMAEPAYIERLARIMTEPPRPDDPFRFRGFDKEDNEPMRLIDPMKFIPPEPVAGECQTDYLRRVVGHLGEHINALAVAQISSDTEARFKAAFPLHENGGADLAKAVRQAADEDDARVHIRAQPDRSFEIVEHRVACVANRIDALGDMLISQIDMLSSRVDQIAGARPRQAIDAGANEMRTEPAPRLAFGGALGAIDCQIVRAEGLLERMEALLMSGLQVELDRFRPLL